MGKKIFIADIDIFLNNFTVDNSISLQINTDKIIIAGASADGGLTAGLAQLVRDRDEFSVLHQLLLYAMLDDRNTEQASDTIEDSVALSRVETCLHGLLISINNQVQKIRPNMQMFI